MKKEKKFHLDNKSGLQPHIGGLSLRGFTIVELLVASVVLVIFFSSITVVFMAANRAWVQSEARTQIYQNTRDALGQMSRELATAFPSSDSNKQLVLTDSTYTIVHPLTEDLVTYDDDRLTFAAAYNFNLSPGEYDLTHLGYRLNTADSDKIKLQKYKKDFGSTDYLGNSYDGSTLANEPAQTWKEMAVYIISLNFRCHDGSSWNDSWSGAVLPKAVEITIKVQDKQKRYKTPMEFKSMVHLSTN